MFSIRWKGLLGFFRTGQGVKWPAWSTDDLGGPQGTKTPKSMSLSENMLPKIEWFIPIFLIKIAILGVYPIGRHTQISDIIRFWLCMYVCIYIYIYIYIQFESHYYVVFWVSSISTLVAHDKRVVSVKKVSLTSNGDWWEDYQRMVVWDLANNYGFQW